MKKWNKDALVDAGYKIENVKITSVDLSMEDHGCLTLSICLDGYGWGCVYGGYVLGNGYVDAEEFEGSAKGMESIMRIMDVVGVSRFNAMKGKIVRVATKGFGSSIKIIGNVLSDKWFDAESFYSEADEEEERKDIPDDVDELRNFVAQSLKEKYDQVNIRKLDTDIIVNVKETNNGRNDVWIQFPYFHSR